MGMSHSCILEKAHEVRLIERRDGCESFPYALEHLAEDAGIVGPTRDGPLADLSAILKGTVKGVASGNLGVAQSMRWNKPHKCTGPYQTLDERFGYVTLIPTSWCRCCCIRCTEGLCRIDKSGGLLRDQLLTLFQGLNR